MSFSNVLGFALPLLGGGVAHDVAAGAATTAGGGLIPVDVQSEAEPGVELTWTFLSGYRLKTERTTLLLSYTPQLYLRKPNVADVDRPLLLHLGDLSYSTAVSETTTWTTDLSGSIGEASYVTTQRVFDEGSGAVPVSVLKLATVSLSNGVQTKTSGRNALGVSLTTGYRTPIGDYGQIESADGTEIRNEPFPSSYDITLGFFDGYSVTRIDTVGVSVSGGYYGTETDDNGPTNPVAQDLAAGSLGVFWSRPLSERSSLRLESGLTGSRVIESKRFDASPTGSVSYTNTWSSDGVVWTNSLGGGVRGFFDPISITYRPQTFWQYSLFAGWNRKWDVGGSVFASTSLAGTPLEPSQFETYGTLEVPVRYTIAQGLQVQVGGRASVRAPHIEEFGEGDFQTEVTGFVGIAGTLGTDRENGAWLR